MEELNNKQVAKGIGWTSISTIVNGLTQVLRLSILTRFLETSDFGLVAILTFILGLTQVFSDLGFSAAIMSEKELGRLRFLNLFWLQFLTFIIIAIIISACSPLLAAYYNNSDLSVLIPIMLIELVFVGIGKLYDTVLQKQMQFKTIAIRNICASVISLVIAIVLAIVGAGVYSLIISTISNAAIVNIWNLLAGQQTYKLKLVKINYSATRDLIKVGAYQMGTQILDYLSSKLDIILISSFLGVSELGIYNLAKELVLKFVLIINSIVNKVMLPVLSITSDNIIQLRNVFKSFVNSITIVNAPIVGFIAVFSPIIIKIFYGAGYEGAYEIVRIMAVWSIFVVLGQPNGLIAISMKRTDLSFSYTIARLVIMSILLFTFARKSLTAAALTMLVSYIFMFFVSWALLLYRTIRISLNEYLKALIKPCIVVAFDISLLTIINKMFIVQDTVLSNIFLMFLYWAVIIIYVVKYERSIKQMLLGVIKKK